MDTYTRVRTRVSQDRANKVAAPISRRGFSEKPGRKRNERGGYATLRRESDRYTECS